MASNYINIKYSGQNWIYPSIEKNANILFEKLSTIFTKDKIRKDGVDYASELDPEYADYSEGPEHSLYLLGLRHRVFLFIIADIYYSLEKKINYYMYKEMFKPNCFYYVAKDEKQKTDLKFFNLDLIKFVKIFKLLGWNIEDKTFWKTIEKYKLLINCYKHGYGRSYEELKEKTGNFFECEYHDHHHIDEPSLCVKRADIDGFLNAIKLFFEEMPIFDIKNENEVFEINKIIGLNKK